MRLFHSFQSIRSFSAQTLTFIGGLFFVVVFAASFMNTAQLLQSPLLAASGVFLTLILIFAASWLLGRQISAKSYLLALIAISLLSRLGWIIWIDTPPDSDFLFMYNAAKLAAAGDFSFNQDEYFLSWVYQFGFTMYEAGMIKLFGGAALFMLKLVNVLFSAATVLLVYYAALELFNEHTARIAGLLYALYIPNIIMCSVLTNQHWSTFFFTFGCLLIISKRFENKYGWLLIGLAFGLANLMRPLSLVYLAGFAAFQLLFRLFKAKSGDYRPAGLSIGKSTTLLLARAAGVFIIFYMVQALASYALVQSEASQYPLSNREPYWKFVVGLNAETDGRWSLEDGKYVLQFKLGEERDAAELALIKERLADPAAVASLFARKLAIFWGEEDSAVMWSLKDMNQEQLAAVLKIAERFLFTAMSAAGVYSLYSLWRSRFAEQHKAGHMLFLILLLGYAFVQLWIEIQARYRLDLLPCFILLQSYGIYMMQMKRIALRKIKADSLN
ncbi:hypothetical protein ASF12_15785 [Paenibacillus sp. Leaf72]|nr:hypothetical protein ASF12_15785 [Paenibacillus sp. Leaf72]